jgi:hypothetical protein
MKFTQKETNNRLKALTESCKGEREIRTLKQIIIEKDKRIVELETEVKTLMKIIKAKI